MALATGPRDGVPPSHRHGSRRRLPGSAARRALLLPRALSHARAVPRPAHNAACTLPRPGSQGLHRQRYAACCPAYRRPPQPFRPARRPPRRPPALSVATTLRRACLAGQRPCAPSAPRTRKAGAEGVCGHDVGQGRVLEVLLAGGGGLPCQLLILLPGAQQEALAQQLLACGQGDIAGRAAKGACAGAARRSSSRQRIQRRAPLARGRPTATS